MGAGCIVEEALLGRVAGEFLDAFAEDVAEVEVALGVEGDAMNPI